MGTPALDKLLEFASRTASLALAILLAFLLWRGLTQPSCEVGEDEEPAAAGLVSVR